MDKNDPIDIVRHFSERVQNGRVLRDAVRHTESELTELYEELAKVEHGLPEGKDGIVGEAIDIMACILDIIFLHRPQTTNEEICEILLRKCEKWERRYANHVDGDRSID